MYFDYIYSLRMVKLFILIKNGQLYIITNSIYICIFLFLWRRFIDHIFILLKIKSELFTYYIKLIIVILYFNYNEMTTCWVCSLIFLFVQLHVFMHLLNYFFLNEISRDIDPMDVVVWDPLVFIEIAYHSSQHKGLCIHNLKLYLVLYQNFYNRGI